MENDVIVTIQLRIKDYEAMHRVVSEMVAAVAEKDPGTRQYNFSVDEQNKTLFVMERYVDAAAFIAHTQTMGPFAARYFETVDVISASIHTAAGVELPAEIKAALAPFGASYMTVIGSFESF